MQTMNISLPDPLKDFVDAQITSGRYSSVSEYVRELIREDEKRKAEARLEAMLLEGLAGAERSSAAHSHRSPLWQGGQGQAPRFLIPNPACNAGGFPLF